MLLQKDLQIGCIAAVIMYMLAGSERQRGRPSGRREAVMYKIMRTLGGFIRRETVLFLSIVLALISAVFVPPSREYISYIDWDTLFLLFSLMAVVKGFQKTGLFLYLGGRMLKKTTTTRQMLLILVFLPFLFSMVITNDVSLITFVPFGLAVLRMTGQERLAVPLLVLQTIAANLGSMLTPMGNPQNLYLYGRAGIGFWGLCKWMLPYVLLSAAGLLVLILLRRSVPISAEAVEVKWEHPKALPFCAAGFVLCLLGIFHLVPDAIIALIVLIFLLFADRKLLASVDYSLLGTFFAFFIFVGNLGNIEGFQELIASLLEKNVELVAILVSQITSNVPAALLLSNFTSDWHGLVVGCNLGGLGTLVASMASLISFKLLGKEYPAKRGKYLLVFTVYNIGFLAALLAGGALI